MQDIQLIAKQFNITAPLICARQLFGGAVHRSYLADLADGSSVTVQALNPKAFPDLKVMVANAAMVSAHIDRTAAEGERRFIRYIPAVQGGLLYTDDRGINWRAYHYIDRAHTPLPDESTEQDCAELAKALGLFYRQLADFPIEQLQTTLPNYHNTMMHFNRFKAAVETAAKPLVDTARQEIAYALKQQKYAGALLKMDLPLRATHGEARLRNLLVDNETGRAVCLIDYDTVMPGLMAYDFGNAVRSGCRACKCDERQMNRIRFDIDRYAEFTRLFLDVTRPILDKREPASLAGGCIVMALEMGIRYLTDYLLGNRQFRVAYPEQNLYKARVQLMLCMQMQYYYKEMENIIKRCL